MAEDLDRDLENVKEKARHDREEKENIYNAYQELLKQKEKDNGQTEAKIRRLEEMNEEKGKKIEEKDEKLEEKDEKIRELEKKCKELKKKIRKARQEMAASDESENNE